MNASFTTLQGDNMEASTLDKLEDAIIRYAKGLDKIALLNYVTDNLRDYYTNSADEEEALAFILQVDYADTYD